ncbi:MAG: DUF4065 domain-containing protein [Alphaproteobacteria bacterium]|nr:DUF4065 domain-containing protein [Alphaproteobacteria bacterium]
MSIRFRFNPRKALEAILLLATRRPGIGFHAILKVLFYADKSHFLDYGRPVVGDTYVAMPYGSVGSYVYDILKADPLALEQLGVEGDLPFAVRGRYQIFAKPGRGPDLSVFSPSDLAAIDESFRENAHLSFRQLVEKTHAEAAYLKADHWMAYEDFVPDGPDRDAIIEDIGSYARRAVV